MLKPTIRLLSTLVALAMTAGAGAQAFYQRSARVVDEQQPTASLTEEPQALARALSVADSLLAVADSANYKTVTVIRPYSPAVFMPVVYSTYRNYTDFRPFDSDYGADSTMRWIDEARAMQRNERMLMQRFAIANPGLVQYNIATLPEAPKVYYGEVDPSKHTIEIREVIPDMPSHLDAKVEKRHWLRTFDASLQFSQAYVSPNWYQGGNNNLNFLANIYYNVKLNPAFHPKLLFESTMQYKLGLNSAPDDSLRNYSISEDLLQLNTTFGYKAAHRWYYSVTAQFKTQLLNSYVKNTRNLSSAFLSPAELNAGIGMTYNYANKKKTFVFDASISPLSYNLRICTKPDDELSHDPYDISPNHTTVSKFGSTAECKMTWQIARNISFKSRIFVFSDYNFIQADWENTLAMDINRYLTTQIYCHARYDSMTPRCDDPSWHKLQVKEILSFGVQYRFSSL